MTPEITLPVAELKQALPGLAKLVSKSRTLPVLQSVRVQRDAEGVVTLEVTDLDTHVAYRLPDAQAGQPAEVLVPFDALLKTAKGSSETLTLIPDGQDKVRLRHHIGNSPVEQRISCPELKEWPVTPKITAPLVPLDPQFGPTLKEALLCASDDSSRVVLKGACLDVTDPKAHYVVGTNGRILFAANSFSFGLKQSVIIPAGKFLAWHGFLSGDSCELAVQNDPKNQNHWVQLRTPRWTYTARQIEGNYPNWKNALPTLTAQGTTLQLSPEAVTQLLEVVPQLPGGENPNRPVRLAVAQHELHVEARPQDDAPWTQIRIDGVAVQGPDLTVSLNRELLLQALRYGLNQIELELPDGVALFSRGGRKCAVKLLTPTLPPPAPTATPPTAATATPTEPATATPTERKVMPQETKPTKPTTQEPLKLALERIEALRETLKNTVRELGDVTEALKAADREQKASAKEVESVRATLRSLQKVAI